MNKMAEWMKFLEKDIEKKYGDTKPVFIINDQYLYTNRIIEMFEEKKIHYWLQYKKTLDGYILKYFPPCPPRDICKQEIDLFLQSLKPNTNQKFFVLSTDELYDEQEIKHELLKILQYTYNTKIVIDSVSNINNKIIYKISVVEDTIPNMYSRKLLYFEYTDKILDCYKTGGKGYIEISDL